MAFSIVCVYCGREFSARQAIRKFCSNDCSHKGRNPSVEERFWSRVNKVDPEQCWAWTGHAGRQGYGVIGIGKKYFMAHRISWELHHGAIPNGMLVCHKCDNPQCCNPHHLFLGDHRANNSDRAQKGRNRNQNGAYNNQAVLTDQQAIDAYCRYEAGESAVSIGKSLGVTHTTISGIVSRREWTHLPMPVSRRWMAARVAGNHFDLESFASAVERVMNARKCSRSQIARESSVPVSTISRLLLRQKAPRLFNVQSLSAWAGINHSTFFNAGV